jgi:hypothetical protein
VANDRILAGGGYARSDRHALSIGTREVRYGSMDVAQRLGDGV